MSAATFQRQHVVSNDCATLTNLQRAEAGNWPQWMRDLAAVADNAKAKCAAARAAERAARPAPQVPAFDLEAARAELARLEGSHSTSYLYADNRTDYRAGLDRENSIAELRRQIERAEQAQQEAA